MRNREDWLVEQLNKDTLAPTVREKYENELEALGQAYERAENAKKAAQEKERARRAEIRAKILANDEDFIWTMGSEQFGDDYETIVEGDTHVVYSKVARDDQENRHVCNTAEAAIHKLRTLLYYRMYDHYVRRGELDVLGELIA